MSQNWWRCTICGYIYKPEIGNAASGVAINTLFQELSEDWVCPVCYYDKSFFVPFTPEE
ncbi:MAG: rubredoxin [Candidatus Hodarchaeales archaeon]